MTHHGSASWLFVPGSRPERFDKAAGAGAHEVIVDLEDAVASAAKESARDDVARWLTGGGPAASASAANCASTRPRSNP